MQQKISRHPIRKHVALTCLAPSLIWRSGAHTPDGTSTKVTFNTEEIQARALWKEVYPAMFG